MSSRTPRNLLRTALDMGLGRAAYRVVWELDNRSGLKRLRTPSGQVPIPTAIPAFDEWRDELGDSHWLRNIPATEESARNDRVREVADRAVEGELLLFGQEWCELGSPPDWHREPASGGRWPADVHWTDAVQASEGDLRTTWELNRFHHVWAWALASGEGADETSGQHRRRYAEAFAEQIFDWGRRNQFRAGVNWASGQELAVRAVNWLIGAAALGELLDEHLFRKLVQLIYWHGFQIESELGFSRWAVPNNHLIAEALGLAVIGDAFVDFSESERWRRRGLDLLLAAVRDQFYEDGGYVQASHSYHRFALELLLLADAWFPEIQGELGGLFARSLRYLSRLVEYDGRLPNFGPNDGARICPDFSADHNDFRPLLRRLEERVENVGSGLATSRRSASFPRAGVHVLRHGEHSAHFRCGELPTRGGHSDGLHVDVWLRERPIAVDPGSFRYISEQHEHDIAARSHNGCTVRGLEPRERLARFTWAAGSSPTLIEFDAERRFAVGSWDALSDEVLWERRVSAHADGVTVVDVLSPIGVVEFPDQYALHWLLGVDPADVEVRGEGCTWNIELPGARIELVVRGVASDPSVPDLVVESASVSWYYGQRAPASRLILSVRGRGIRFETRFVDTD